MGSFGDDMANLWGAMERIGESYGEIWGRYGEAMGQLWLGYLEAMGTCGYTMAELWEAARKLWRGNLK